MRDTKRLYYVIVILAAGGLLSLPYYANPAWTILTTKAMIWALFALSFNMIFGFGGMLSIGHAAFFGIGAYVSAILVKDYDLFAIFALLIGVIAGALAGLAFARISIRFGGFRFAMITLALGQLVWVVGFRWYGMTKGDDGYWGVPRPVYAQSDVAFFYFTAIIVVVAGWGLWRLLRSPFGKILTAVRDNERRAESIGVDSLRHRKSALIISSAFSALAGGLYAFFLEGATPELLNWTTSAEVIVMSLLGGIGAFIGPAVGAFIIVFLEDAVSRQFEYWLLLLGSILMVLVLILPGGAAGAGQTIAQRSGLWKRTHE